ncbi:dead-domain-containing protein [Ceraceosorus bombacis]|uniref:ATP-dependent RNA helicase n=1 Tax=Ceraceosorus bombacis TaxID=401625 RepID=A0A0P1BTV8_9BASI|nr:dead-domain-containing protein [Ceraceosorus bombacis]
MIARRAVNAALAGARRSGARTSVRLLSAGTSTISALLSASTAFGPVSSSTPRNAFTSHVKSALAVRSYSTAESAVASEAELEEEDEQRQQEEEQAARAPKPVVPRDGTFASLKGHIDYGTFKALTVKPFGYVDMSDVQREVLHLLPKLADVKSGEMEDGKGRDLLVKAKTGTGKTLAFMVPAVESRINAIHDVERGIFNQPFSEMLKRHRPDFDFSSLDKHGRKALVRQYVANTVGTLVISPTRELATQIANEAIKLHHFHEGYECRLLVGGASRHMQLKDWRRGRPDVVVATPGRLLDLLQEDEMVRDAISATQTFILDEADTLLDMGFRDDIAKIREYLPPREQRTNFLFSATVSKEIRKLTHSLLEKSHRFIDTVPEGEENVHQNIPQFATEAPSGMDQMVHLVNLVAHDQIVNAGKSKVIIFAPTTKLTEFISELLLSKSVKSLLPCGTSTFMNVIHSGKDQDKRFRVSSQFRSYKNGAAVLVTSDVSARGVDYPGTTRVIQISVPPGADNYIHRVGRTGRAGADGRGDIILAPCEKPFLTGVLSKLAPVQELAFSDFQQELQDLCKRYDEEPESVVDRKTLKMLTGPDQRPDPRQRREPNGFRIPQAKFVGSFSEKLDPGHVQSVLGEQISRMSEESGNDRLVGIAMSHLGFISGHADALNLSKSAALEGQKEWVDSLSRGSERLYVSKMMIDKLGLNDRRGSGFAKACPPSSHHVSNVQNFCPKREQARAGALLFWQRIVLGGHISKGQ